MVHLILMGRVPSKKNSKQIVCRGKFPKVLPSKAYIDWEVEKLWELKKSKPLVPYPKVAKVEIIFTLPDKRRCDLTNKAESIMDLLVAAEILADDSWQVVPHIELRCTGTDPNYPITEIVITP